MSFLEFPLTCFDCHCPSLLPPLWEAVGGIMGSLSLPMLLHVCFLLGPRSVTCNIATKRSLLNLIVKCPLTPKSLCTGLTLSQLKFSLSLSICTFYLCAFITCLWPCGMFQPSSQKSSLSSLLFNPSPLICTTLTLPRGIGPFLINSGVNDRPTLNPAMV